MVAERFFQWARKTLTSFVKFGDGSRVSGASVKPPPLPHLLTPDSLLHLECPPGQQLRLTQKDGETLSDQLGNFDTGHISMEELGFHGHKKFPLRSTAFVYPVSRVWAIMVHLHRSKLHACSLSSGHAHRRKMSECGSSSPQVFERVFRFSH